MTLKQYAKALRKHQTRGERALWMLRLISYKPQQPTNGFIPDFYSGLWRVSIEVDGSVHKKKEVRRRDRHKARAMAKHHIYTMRVSNDYAIYCTPIVLLEALATGIIWRAWLVISLSC